MVLLGAVVVERWGRRPAALLGFPGQAVFLALPALSANVPFGLVVLLFAAAMFCSNSGPGFMTLLTRARCLRPRCGRAPSAWPPAPAGSAPETRGRELEGITEAQSVTPPAARPAGGASG
jgi:hypothetical protein